MPPPPDARKRRTRQHVIADQSLNHVERFVIDEGHVAHRLTADYGYDLLMMTFDEHGYAEPGVIFLQLKASESLSRSGENYAFDLDVRDYNLWRVEPFPVILVLFDASRRKAYWLHVQGYVADNPARRPARGAKTVRVLVGRRQTVSRRAAARWRRLKAMIAAGLA